MMNNKLLIICGPTATGKTKLGIELAKKFNGEIISADSRQVYQGMNIGTGKDTGNLKFEIYPAIRGISLRLNNLKSILNLQFEIGYYVMDGVKVWLLDIVKPNYRFNVSDYKECADLVIDDILQRGKLPVIIGGTGFYIKAITEEIGTMEISPNWELRERLSHCSISSLFKELTKIDPERSRRMNESDRQNPRRLVRAIEITEWELKMNCRKPPRHSGDPPAGGDSRIDSGQARMTTNLQPLFIGLTASNETLYQRINQRVEERVKAGVENEIRGLMEKGYNFENSALGNTLAYGEWKEYFEGKKTKEEIIQKWKYDEHNYSRRQMTWFKKNKKINWFDISQSGFENKVEMLVKDWYIKGKCPEK